MTKITITQDTPVLVAIDISKSRHEVLIAVPDKKRRRRLRECPTFCVTWIWFMLPERSKDENDDDFQGTAGRIAEGLRAA